MTDDTRALLGMMVIAIMLLLALALLFGPPIQPAH